MKKIIFIIFISTLIISACSNNEKIQISSPSYMYSKSTSISKELEVTLRGDFNKDDDNYEGSLSINEINFEKVLFKHNSLLIAYEGSERTVLGNIYLNKSENEFSITITDPTLYKKLTNEEFKKDNLVISSPAFSQEEAIEVAEKLKAME
ncbi:hypothetical protein [Paenibacillus sp. OK076]|uniref:hypothetical protein n=1 Tax=Paenibacillus sp. OK076 TaxID=1884379 RepID=UPI0008CEE56C|nr:hypothetical protein [Paenibacillus sp. OK076]SEO05955.1 hypothetical protein SAMN05518670_3502 [Paenibacillus sp. OK076]